MNPYEAIVPDEPDVELLLAVLDVELADEKAV